MTLFHKIFMTQPISNGFGLHRFWRQFVILLGLRLNFFCPRHAHPLFTCLQQCLYLSLWNLTCCTSVQLISFDVQPVQKLIFVVMLGMLLKLRHVYAGGTHTLWTDMMWRSCARPSGRPSRSRASPLPLLPRHLRAKDSKVSGVWYYAQNIFLFECSGFKYSLLFFSVDIEDLDNWHGKPIPKDRVTDLLNDLKALIQVPNKTLCPELPNEDAAPADLSPIYLPAPPAYKKGDKVLLLVNHRRLRYRWNFFWWVQSLIDLWWPVG